ncbi:MAG: ribosome maturation factor RimM [Candidatus Hydrogenedentales bacterium]|jgi:ribosomal 30S subunit maturation factor RimM
MHNRWREIGHVVAVESAQRSVRIKATPNGLTEFESLDRFWLDIGTGNPFCVRIADKQFLRNLVKIRFTPGLSKDMVKKLVNAQVLLPLSSDAGEAEESFSLSTLSGLQVMVPSGEILGTVIETIDTPAGGVVRLEMHDGRTAALPFVDQVFKSVDRSRNVIHVADVTPFLVMDDLSPDC